MNTTFKAVTNRQCKICGRTYGLSGSTAYELAQHRHPDTDDQGETLQGICPRHKRKDAE